VALIAGPTASGKSGLAIDLAIALEKQGRKGIIINADSAQVYADLKVLSARPSTEEMRGIEHRLFGTWDGAEACSAADWAERARQEIDAALADGAVPILVGGTGMYLKVLLEGIAPIPEIDTAIREQVRSLDAAAAWDQLSVFDPERAQSLAPTDSQRIARSLEVVLSTGKTLTEWQKQKSGGIGEAIALHPAILLPPRDWLYERCDRRFVEMIKMGALEEVEALIARKIDPDLPVMRAIGVREVQMAIAGEFLLKDCIAMGQQATRNYAKRQFTWFRNQTPERWPQYESYPYELHPIFDGLLQH